ncbi:thiamine pyrophosphate enzyme family protein [Colwellia phage 9A]|uniref:Thiamine pyrophosphate enzyme family protein n=1 Tax=Colwellia phage 9A TaxID=765765 RepID=I3UMA5_9CAUD|nr:thiamine pyrophosphate enzyme family protein [Colwellia phage 9A]AFK66620.1 thiamine pyrophosphate enzyme family protein [Colwellia phage 9A]
MISDYRRIELDMLKPIQMTLLSRQRKLEFQYSSRCDLQLVSGNIVKHYGASSRKGWIGIVIGASTGTDRIDVVWLLNDGGNDINKEFFAKSKSYVGVPQSYSNQWTIEGFRLCTNVTNIYDHETGVYPFNVKPKRVLIKKADKEKEPVKEVEKKVEPKEKFIIWSPSGTRNPTKVHDTLTVATKVAVDMAIKHNKEFFVCKLVVKTKPLKKARIIQL